MIKKANGKETCNILIFFSITSINFSFSNPNRFSSKSDLNRIQPNFLTRPDPIRIYELQF